MNVLKNNWKKATFFSLVCVYGAHRCKTYIEVQSHMREVCAEAALYGATLTNSKPERILVVVNPAANGNKAEKNFKEYCEPILQLAGLNVEIVRTSTAGSAKAYIETKQDLADAVVVAGGDGTASEVVTGLMRSGKSNCPLAILPLGKRAYTENNKVDFVKKLTNSALTVLRGRVTPASVMRYESVPKDNESENSTKPIYGISSFAWGVMRDLEAIKDKYWYFGPFRRQVAALFNAFSDKLSWNCAATITYSPLCDGCIDCYKSNYQASRKNWLHLLSQKNRQPATNYANISLGTNCKPPESCDVEFSQITIDPLCDPATSCKLVLKSYPTIAPGMDFIMKNLNPNEKEHISKTIDSRYLLITPTTASGEKQYYSIDGEEYEVSPVRIALLREAIRVFA